MSLTHCVCNAVLNEKATYLLCCSVSVGVLCDCETEYHVNWRQPFLSQEENKFLTLNVVYIFRIFALFRGLEPGSFKEIFPGKEFSVSW